jgi:hypothetical protein
MMRGLYAVYDRCSRVYDGPIPQANDDTAIRAFTQMCNNPQSTVAQSPEDFTLFKVGEFDDATGEVVGLVPEKLISAHEIAQPESIKVGGSI